MQKDFKFKFGFIYYFPCGKLNGEMENHHRGHNVSRLKSVSTHFDRISEAF